MTTRPTYTPPRPSASRPAPSARPDYTPSTPTRYAPSRPATNQPGTTRPGSVVPGSRVPTPGTTTRSDAQPPRQPGSSRSTATTRPAPSAIGGSVRSSSAGTSSRDLYDRARASRGDKVTPTRSTPIDSRYTNARPSAASKPGTNVRDSGIPTSRATSRPTKAPTAIDRFRPGDVTTTARPRSTATPTTGIRAATPVGTTAIGTTTIGSNTIVRSHGAPRLTPRTEHRRSGAARSSFYGTVRVYDPWCHTSGWYSHSHSYGWRSPWHVHCGTGLFSWHWSLWTPFFCGYSTLWNDCHRDWWWNRHTYHGSCSSYWWYPSSVYCPSYLYVPSSVVIVDSGSYHETESSAPVAAPAVVAEAPGAGRAPAPRTLAEKYVELGDFYFKAGRFEDAADAYARARTYAPNDAGIHFVLADAAFANGDYHFAAFLIKEALRLDPSLATAEIDKRDFYGDPKLFDEHMAALERYLEEKPYDAMAHLVRGYNLRMSLRPALAIVAFRRVLEIAPDDRAARAFLDALEPPTLPEPSTMKTDR